MALIPAIIEAIWGPNPLGRLVSGGRGGGGPKDPNEVMRNWMLKNQWMGDIDAVDKNVNESAPDAPRTLIPQIRSAIEANQGFRFTPVPPGPFAPPRQ